MAGELRQTAFGSLIVGVFRFFDFLGFFALGDLQSDQINIWLLHDVAEVLKARH